MGETVEVVQGELKACPFCTKPLTIRGGRNPYGRCDTDGCWMNARMIVVVMHDPAQVLRREAGATAGTVER